MSVRRGLLCVIVAVVVGSALPARANCNVEVRPVPPVPVVFPPGTEWKLCTGYRVSFQKDGNLVVYNRRRLAVWDTQTNDQGVTALVMDIDGDLMIYAGSKPLWNAGTHGHPGAFLDLQEDGNVVVYAPDMKPLWASYTNGK